MSFIQVQKIDEVRIRILCDSGTLRSDLKETFSFFVPGYMHMEKYKQGWWDGRISLFEHKSQSIYLGLFEKIREFAASRECEFVYNETEFPKATHDLEKFTETFKASHELRDYQKEVLRIASIEKKALFISATGSGKSLSIYSMLRLINKPTLLIVPSIQLVGQMYGDFKKYSADDPTFQIEDMVQQIHGGQTKDVTKQIVVSTWQSIYNLPSEYFSKFKLVIADEAHEDKASKLRQLIEKCGNSEYRYGFTGTLDGTHTNEMILKGLFGDVHQVSSTSDLIEKGILADMSLSQVLLQYPQHTRKIMARKLYQDEVFFLLNAESRRDFITKLALRCPGNTLVLYQRVAEHGQKIYDHLVAENEAKGLKRKIFFIHGKIKKDERLDIVNTAETEDGVIIVASLGTFARGINIQNLENLIFAFGLKAKITTLQGIGRGLRIGRTGKVNVFDICDDLTWGKWINYSLKHAMERLMIYQKERFNYKMVKVQL